MSNRRVIVLHGGFSAEREVSLDSGAAVAQALGEAGYDIVPIDAGQPLDELVAAVGRAAGGGEDSILFNALHGRWGEDGCIQGVLELLKLPYTHSGVLASALAMDKPAAKQVFAAAGLPIAEHTVVTRDRVAAGEPMPRPFVIKPTNEGSSVGVTIVQPGDNYNPLVDGIWAFGAATMIERYIPGRELTVSVIGAGEKARALGVTEIVAREGGFYDYQAKYTREKAARHIVPAPVPLALAHEAMRISVEAHRALGCAGVARADLRLDESGGESRLFLLEVNTQPGMTAMSLVPEQAAAIGMDFSALCAWIVEEARARAEGRPAPEPAFAPPDSREAQG